MKYLCQSSDCLNEVHPCIDGFVCNICKIKLFKTTNNDLNRKLPVEIRDMIYIYVTKNKDAIKCLRCKKTICTDCSQYYMPWCCICHEIKLFNFFDC